jgi:fluoroacetyl-CoA thioesterase
MTEKHEGTIEVGLKGTAEQLVLESLLASSLGSGNVDVYGTPAMIALIEAASVNCIAPFLKPEETSVGKRF